MYFIQCFQLKSNPIGRVKHQIIENYLIAIGGKLNSDQVNRLSSTISLHREIHILCIDRIQADYLLAVLNKANDSREWRFNIIDANPDDMF